ncbi:MAG: hypothetical protein ABIR34_01165 [Marmoricola sp.]
MSTGPTENRWDPGSPYRVPWVIAAAVTALVLVLALLVLLGGRWGFPGGADCTVTVDGRTVRLSTGTTEDAAAITAGAVRQRISLRTTSASLKDGLDLDEREARVAASALTGRTPHALTCVHGGAEDAESNRLNRAGLTRRAATARRDVERAFGKQKLGGFAPGGVRSGHMRGSAHYEGRAVDVFFRPVNQKNRVKGWAMAQYLVADADRLELDTVIYDAHIWTARRAAQGWRSYRPDTAGRSAQVAAILEHRDHVHLDVAD